MVDACLVDRVAQAADSGGHVTIVESSDSKRRSWAQLLDEAGQTAAALQAFGVAPHSHVGLLGRTSPELLRAILAIWLCGATVVMLPMPVRQLEPRHAHAHLKSLSSYAEVDLLLVDPGLGTLARGAAPQIASLAGLMDAGAPLEASFDSSPVASVTGADLAAIQFTSGSTADPKGVMLPHENICVNVDAMCEGAGLRLGEDTFVSWLPLFHDMGFIGFLVMPMIAGMDLVLADPSTWVGAPQSWMEWISAFHATVTGGPDSAYAIATRFLQASSGALDLSSLRVAFNGAEPISPESLERYCAVAETHAFNRRAMFCVFGMAEVTLAATFPDPGSGMQVDVVDRASLEREGIAAPAHKRGRSLRRLPLLGRPLRGLEIRVVDPQDGALRPEREVGELEIRGSSLTPGYFRHPDLTAQTLRDGWLRTGDLAYMVGDQLVVCGRLKDVVIVMGRNVLPEEIEWATASVSGVRAGNAIAFGTSTSSGREGLVVVAECRSATPKIVRDNVARAIREAVGVTPADIVLVEPRTLPKTSSGKLQRSRCRAAYMSGELSTVAGQ